MLLCSCFVFNRHYFIISVKLMYCQGFLCVIIIHHNACLSVQELSFASVSCLSLSPGMYRGILRLQNSALDFFSFSFFFFGGGGGGAIWAFTVT